MSHADPTEIVFDRDVSLNAGISGAIEIRRDDRYRSSQPLATLTYDDARDLHKWLGVHLAAWEPYRQADS